MSASQRNYNTKDVDMLVAAATILESAVTNKAFLQAARSTWADPFFEALQTKIDTAVQQHLGIDSAKDLRLSTQALTVIQKQALKDLAQAKVQITEDFKTNKPRQAEILNQLGFTAYHKDAQNGDQEALISLLFHFKTNLTQDLQTEISTAGAPESLLQAITGYADELKDADVAQEGFKAQRKIITAAAVQEFNEIYDTVISICKIAANLYKDQPLLQEQFSFHRVSAALNAANGTAPTSPAPPTT